MSSSGLLPSRPPWPLTPLALTCLIVSGEVLGVDDRPNELPSRVITANPLGNESPVTSSSILEGGGLTLRQKDSLDEALNGLPEISSTYFGPGASRPVTRDMDGDRIRLLCDGADALDASPLSYGHAVPKNPNNVERLEVTRGPAAPLYGSSIIDGVMSSFDNHILSEPIDGIHSGGKLRHDGADITRSRSGILEAGDGNFVLRMDAANREFNDIKIPGYTYSSRQRQIGGDIGKYRVQNGDGRQDGSAVGGSYRWGHGYAGSFYSGYDSNYSLSAEDDACLRMQQGRYTSTSEIRDLEGPFISLKLGAAYIKHEYEEVEDGEIGTTLRNEGYESRIEAHHRPPGPLNEVIGAQFVNSRFPVLGKEALVPHTEIDSAALFALEGWKLSDRLDPSLGVRLEHVRVDPDAKGSKRFAESDGSQSFITGSPPTGAVYKLTPIWSLAVALSYTGCASTLYELYANGSHAATGTYEVGNTDADKEKVISTDLALCFDSGVHEGNVGVLYSHFSSYTGLLAGGRRHNEEGEVVVTGDDEALLEYPCSDVRADSYSIEAWDHIHLLESSYSNFGLELSEDYTYAKDRDAGKPLPRIAPLRLSTALIWELQQWQTWVDVEHAALQHRVPEEEPSTDGHTTFGTNLGYNFDFGENCWLVFVKGTSPTNQTVHHASPILRDRVPAVGHDIETGVKVVF